MNPNSFSNNQKNDGQNPQVANIMQGGPTSVAAPQIPLPQEDFDPTDNANVSNQADMV